VLSIYTPDYFESNSDLSELEARGFENMKNVRCVIASMVRDVIHEVPRMKEKVERLGKRFNDYVFLIVENDSKDGTREALLEWAKENPRVVILGCGVNVDHCKLNFAKTDGHNIDRRRIEKMSILRNIYLDYIREHFSTWNYAIFWDLDALGSVYHDGIATSFAYLQDQPSIDVMCANGIYESGPVNFYYDTYAHVDANDTFDIESKEQMDYYKRLWSARYTRGDPLVDVKSCFSGFTIYRISAVTIPTVHYDMSGEDNLECEHVRLHGKMFGRKVVNPSMMHVLLHNP